MGLSWLNHIIVPYENIQYIHLLKQTNEKNIYICI